MSMLAPHFALLALAGSLVAAVPAYAEPESNAVSVYYADLDLNSDAGAAELQARVERAATRVCGPVDSRDLTAMSEAAKCRAIALKDAAPQVRMALGEARSGSGYAANAVKNHARN